MWGLTFRCVCCIPTIMATLTVLAYIFLPLSQSQFYPTSHPGINNRAIVPEEHDFWQNACLYSVSVANTLQTSANITPSNAEPPHIVTLVELYYNSNSCLYTCIGNKKIYICNLLTVRINLTSPIIIAQVLQTESILVLQ